MRIYISDRQRFPSIVGADWREKWEILPVSWTASTSRYCVAPAGGRPVDERGAREPRERQPRHLSPAHTGGYSARATSRVSAQEIAPSPQSALGALVMVGVVLDRSTPESFAAFEGAVLGMKDVLD